MCAGACCGGHFAGLGYQLGRAMVVAGSAAALLLLQRKSLAATVRLTWARLKVPGYRVRVLLALLIVGVLGIRLLHLSSIAPANFDSGLYHFQSLRWLNEYPTVPELCRYRNQDSSRNQLEWKARRPCKLPSPRHRGYSLSQRRLWKWYRPESKLAGAIELR